MFDTLFSQLRTGRTLWPNRICFLTHRTNFARNGRLNNRLTAYYERRARGGCGAIVVGELCIHPHDRPWESMIEAYRDEVVEDYARLTDAVHVHGTKVFAQLRHHGFQSGAAVSRRPVLGPSACADIVFGETAKAMEPEDIEELTKAFARAAVLARDGGFDGVEIDMGPESVLRQFLSPISNHRNDAYGGSFEDRMRFPLEVVDAVRQAVGSLLTIGVRLCVDERFWGGISPKDSRQAAGLLEASGQVDFLIVSLGTFYNLHLAVPSMFVPFGFTVELSEHMKESVGLPVVASHQIEFPHQAEQILAAGNADAVGLVRNLICDPDAPRKAKEGRFDEIRHCLRGNEGCVGRINRGADLGCVQNPSAGFESRSGPATLQRIGDRKDILILGGGPAGLAAAVAAAERGHRVRLWECRTELGGQVRLIQRQPGRDGMGKMIQYMSNALKRLGVEVSTGTPATCEMITAADPDAVIVATGSRPIRKPVPGEYGPPLVLDVWSVLEEAYPVGDWVLFIDENGGHHATGTVEYMADCGRKIDMVTSEPFIGIDLAATGDLYMTRQRLLQKGVTFTCDTVIDGIQGGRVEGHHLFSNQEVVLEGYDTIVLDMGDGVEDALYRSLKGKVRVLYRVGDCVAPRGLGSAVCEGSRLGEEL